MFPELLPPEILCAIVDFVSPDFNALAALSLVCRTWLSPSRRVFFKSLVVTPETVQRFLKLFQSPLVSIPDFAQELKICRYKTGDTRYIDSCIFEILAPALEKLERLTILRLEHLSWETPETSLEDLLRHFGGVTSLWLENNRFADMQHLGDFMSSFLHLQDLTLIYTVLPPTDTDDLSGAGVPRGLRRLCIIGPIPVNSIIAWIAASPAPISLQRLELGGIGFRITSHVHTLLKGAGPHLRELILRPTSRPFFRVGVQVGSILSVPRMEYLSTAFLSLKTFRGISTLAATRSFVTSGCRVQSNHLCAILSSASSLPLTVLRSRRLSCLSSYHSQRNGKNGLTTYVPGPCLPA